MFENFAKMGAPAYFQGMFVPKEKNSIGNICVAGAELVFGRIFDCIGFSRSGEFRETGFLKDGKHQPDMAGSN